MLAHMGTYPGNNFHTFVYKLLHEMKYRGAYSGVGTCLGHYGSFSFTFAMDVLLLQVVLALAQGHLLQRDLPPIPPAPRDHLIPPRHLDHIPLPPLDPTPLHRLDHIPLHHLDLIPLVLRDRILLDPRDRTPLLHRGHIHRQHSKHQGAIM